MRFISVKVVSEQSRSFAANHPPGRRRVAFASASRGDAAGGLLEAGLRVDDAHRVGLRRAVADKFGPALLLVIAARGEELSIRVLLPHPEANTMPAPKSSPPTALDIQIQREPA